MANVHTPTPRNATIAANASLSGAIDLFRSDGETVCGIVTPPAWDAAAIAFKVSADGVTYVPLYDGRTPGSATEVTVPSASIPTVSSAAFALDPSLFAGFSYLKIVSGTNASGVNQTAARTLYLMTRRV